MGTKRMRKKMRMRKGRWRKKRTMRMSHLVRRKRGFSNSSR